MSLTYFRIQQYPVNNTYNMNDKVHNNKIFHNNRIERKPIC